MLSHLQLLQWTSGLFECHSCYIADLLLIFSVLWTSTFAKLVALHHSSFCYWDYLTHMHAFHPTNDFDIAGWLLCNTMHVSYPCTCNIYYTVMLCIPADTLYVHGTMVLMPGSEANNMDHIFYSSIITLDFFWSGYVHGQQNIWNS